MSVINRVIAVLLLTVVAGCGGGSGSSSGAGGGLPGASDQTLNIGNFVTRISGTTQVPVSVAGTGATIAGIAGGTVSSLTLTNPALTTANSQQTLAQTHILFLRAGQIYQTTPAGSAAQAVTTFAASTVRSGASWSPDGSRVAFTQYDYGTGHSQLYVMYINGTGITRISDGSTDDSFPVWSPTGLKIAFQRQDNALGLSQIFIVNATGGAVTRLSDGTVNDFTPSWSPTGDRLLFVRSVSGTGQLVIMNADGSGAHFVTNAAAGSSYGTPSWSPDGTKIAAIINNSAGGSVAVLRIDGAAVGQLTGASDSDSAPTWSPDSSKIAYSKFDTVVSRYQIWVMNQDGTAAHSISDGATDDLNPVWSPYVRFRRIVGAGALASTSAGFLAGQQGKIVNSIVLFNATTPDSAFMTVPPNANAGQPTLAITVTADLLTSLLFINNFSFPAVTVLAGTTTATGAVVTFDANDGTVSTVLPFNSKKAAPLKAASERVGSELILRRSFTGVWDAKGKNLAPGGASEVHVNAHTGQLVSFH